MQESTLKPIPVLICANKTDLRRQFSGNECRGFVSTEEGRSLALVSQIESFLFEICFVISMIAVKMSVVICELYKTISPRKHRTRQLGNSSRSALRNEKR